MKHGGAVYKTLKVLVVLWAWGCWGRVVYSHQWLWLVASLIPYVLFNAFGHHLDTTEPEA